MRVFSFGLFLWRTSLMELWPKIVRLILLIFNFIQFYQFYWFYVSFEDNWYYLICFIFRLLNCSCMPLLTTKFSIHALLTQTYRCTCAYFCTSLGIHHTTRWGVSDSPGSACPDPRVWSLWILPVADQRCAAGAWIISRPSECTIGGLNFRGYRTEFHSYG